MAPEITSGETEMQGGTRQGTSWSHSCTPLLTPPGFIPSIFAAPPLLAPPFARLLSPPCVFLFCTLIFKPCFVPPPPPILHSFCPSPPLSPPMGTSWMQGHPISPHPRASVSPPAAQAPGGILGRGHWGPWGNPAVHPFSELVSVLP